MLKDLFGDTPQVEALEKIAKCLEDYTCIFPSKDEITNDLEITSETLDSFDEDFLKLAYLVKNELFEIYRVLSLKDEIDKILPKNHSFNEEFEKISENFILYEKKFVKAFLTENYGLVSYINHITPIVNRYFQDYPKMIVFHKDPEIYSLSRIVIYIKSSEDAESKDEETLKKLDDELRNFNLFPKDIKFLCSIRLDCYEIYFNDDGISNEYRKYWEFYSEKYEKILELF